MTGQIDWIAYGLYVSSAIFFVCAIASLRKARAERQSTEAMSIGIGRQMERLLQTSGTGS